MWNSVSERPDVCDELERIAVVGSRLSNKGSRCWAPGHPDIVRHLEVSEEQQTLLSIPHVQDAQCASPLLVQCASA